MFCQKLCSSGNLVLTEGGLNGLLAHLSALRVNMQSCILFINGCACVRTYGCCCKSVKTLTLIGVQKTGVAWSQLFG